LIIPRELRPVHELPQTKQQNEESANAPMRGAPQSNELSQQSSRPLIFASFDIKKLSGLSEDSELSFGLFNMIIVFATDIAILLTFGTMFPLLAIVGSGVVWLRTLKIQLVVARLIFLAKQHSYLEPLCKDLNQECIEISKMLMNCLLSLPSLLALLWSWFLFDIWGDSAGYYPAILIVFALPFFPLIGFPFIGPLLRRYVTDKLFPPEPSTNDGVSDPSLRTESNGSLNAIELLHNSTIHNPMS
jgi:hypothetical protein